MNKEKIIVHLVDCEFQDRPVLDWKGFGKVPENALPLHDVWWNQRMGEGYQNEVCMENRQIPVKIDNSYREQLEFAYLRNYNIPIEFSGVIEKFGKSKVMFDKLLFWDNSAYYDIVEDYMEEHVWVNIDSKKIPKNVHVGDTILFSGIIYLYRRKNGTLDYGIGDFDFWEKVEDRVVPSEEKLEKEHLDSAIREIVCETCPLYEKCDLLFCYNEEHRDKMTRMVKTISIIQKIKYGEILSLEDMEYIRIKPDMVDMLYILCTEYLELSFEEYHKRGRNCFLDTKEEWLQYMRNNGYMI